MPNRRIELDELHRLVAWLRRHKGESTYEDLAEACRFRPGACTLRRAVDGRRLPTWNTVNAFAQATDADVGEARRLWQSAQNADAAARTVPRPAGHKPYAPGRITTRKGLAAAMRRVHREAGSPSLRSLEREGAGELPRSTLTLALADERLPTGRLLAAFLTACRASQPVTESLTTARDRLDPRTRPPVRHRAYPCPDADPAFQEAIERKERDEEIKRKTGQLREPDDDDGLLGVTYLHDRYSDAEIEAWETEHAEELARAAAEQVQEPGQMRIRLKDITARIRPGSTTSPMTFAELRPQSQPPPGR
ncbi:hypothetical protein [Streptomyces acidiscabies]|uniref:hypothetical protein n=1 Tax=Streptomyces acidiscabies TaxID=42234 RepID=UPI0009511EB4|nr:hypothetical protein [Streptomyces acidiscabies]